MSIKAVLLAVGAWALMAAFQNVEASALSVTSDSSSVLFDESRFAQGGLGYTDKIVVPGAGEVFFGLTDLVFPQAFGSLKFDVTGGNNSAMDLLAPLSESGNVVSFNASGPMTLYADIFTQPGTTDVGLYNFQATFVSSSTVPLPASAPLLVVATLIIVLLIMLPADWTFGLARAVRSDR